MSLINDNLPPREPHEAPEHIDMLVGPGQTVDNRRFGALLARLREDAGLSRSDASAELGLSSEYLRLIENGKRTPALGNMRNFLDVYQARGVVRSLQPGGDRPDLLIFPPDEMDPTIVEFTSRIREARGSSSRASRRRGLPKGIGRDRFPADHAEELGQVVSLLTLADRQTLAKVRDFLQSAADGDVDPLIE